ncbi:MAG: NTP transferase domain-containing protein [Cyanobacteria bacterium P01_A01_bin.84]
MKKVAIILAAGLSRRMGSCKTSLMWIDGQRLLTYQTQEWLFVGFTPVVILGVHNQDKAKYSCPGSLNVVNYNSNLGKVSSILTGLNHISDAVEVIAISAIDQPRSLEVYQKLYESHKDSSSLITAPIYNDKMGHPLLFSHKIRKNLESIKEETLGLRQIIQEFDLEVNRVDFDDSQVLLDMNTPSVYQNSLLLVKNNI